MAKHDNEEELVEVGFHMGLCPEYEEKDMIDCMNFIHASIKYILILEAEEGHEYPFNRVICDGKYLIEAFDHNEAAVELAIKKGQVKKFLEYVETVVAKHKVLFDFSKEISKQDFDDVITTGMLVSSVALEGNMPGLASKMAFVTLTTP